MYQNETAGFCHCCFFSETILISCCLLQEPVCSVQSFSLTHKYFCDVLSRSQTQFLGQGSTLTCSDSALLSLKLGANYYTVKHWSRYLPYIPLVQDFYKM